MLTDAQSSQVGSMHASVGSLVMSINIGVKVLDGLSNYSHSYGLPNSELRRFDVRTEFYNGPGKPEPWVIKLHSVHQLAKRVEDTHSCPRVIGSVPPVIGWA